MRQSVPALRLPALFIGHGLASNAVDDNVFTESWSCLGSGIGKPRGVLVISAHWMTAGSIQVTAMERPRTLHGEHNPTLQSFTYPAPGSSELAARVRELLQPEAVEYSSDWGLDEGSWTVLSHFYPAADVPVVQLSLNISEPMAWHFYTAEKLRMLRSEGYLIIGSGNLVHNTVMADYDADNMAYSWALRFQKNIAEAIREGRHEDLLDLTSLGQESGLAVPSPEHYLPLLYVLATRDMQDDALEFITPQCIYGSLSMMSVALWPSANPQAE